MVTSGEEGFSELEIIKMLFFLNTNIPITSDHVGCRLSVVGCRLSVVGCRLSVRIYLSLVGNFFPVSSVVSNFLRPLSLVG